MPRLVRTPIAALAVFAALAAAPTSPIAQQQLPPASSSPTPGMSEAHDGQPRVGVHDTLRLRVVEWRAGTGETFAWEALDGEIRVGADGHIALPLVGAVAAAGRTPEEIGEEIGARLQERVGLRDTPSAVVEIAASRPIFVVGSVEAPGSYEFQPGLVVLQAVGLAGGLRRTGEITDRLERDAIGSRGRLREIALELDQRTARRARYEAELAGSPTIDFPDDIVERAAEEPILARIMQEEEMILASRDESFAREIEANERLQRMLEQQIAQLEEQMLLKERQITSLEEELDGVRSLVQRGLGTAARLGDLERRLADYETGRFDITRSIIQAQVDINQAERNVIALQATRRRDAALAIRETQGMIERLSERFETEARMLDEAEVIAPAMRDARARLEATAPRFSILREVDGQTREFPADETARLMPGDTVRVVRPLPQIPHRDPGAVSRRPGERLGEAAQLTGAGMR